MNVAHARCRDRQENESDQGLAGCELRTVDRDHTLLHYSPAKGHAGEGPAGDVIAGGEAEEDRQPPPAAENRGYRDAQASIDCGGRDAP